MAKWGSLWFCKIARQKQMVSKMAHQKQMVSKMSGNPSVGRLIVPQRPLLELM